MSAVDLYLQHISTYTLYTLCLYGRISKFWILSHSVAVTAMLSRSAFVVTMSFGAGFGEIDFRAGSWQKCRVRSYLMFIWSWSLHRCFGLPNLSFQSVTECQF
jgi:hypothetical protein